MSTQPTAVLVHGAFADASGYAGVIRHLQEQGVAVRAPMNPLRGLVSDAEAVRRYTNTIDGRSSLWAIRTAAPSSRRPAPSMKDACTLVFLSAFALNKGETCVSVMEPFPPALLATTNVPSPYDAPGARRRPQSVHQDRAVPRSLLRRSERRRRRLHGSQPAPPGSGRVHRASISRWLARPFTLVRRVRARQCDPARRERLMAQRMNAVTESVDGSHAALVGQPEIATDLILKALASA